MIYHVNVVFGKDREYKYQFSDTDLAGITPEHARRWFDSEFASLECEPTNPMGKVLILDKILNVAKDGGEQRFKDGKEWAASFSRNAALALGRDTIKIDLMEFAIGY